MASLTYYGTLSLSALYLKRRILKSILDFTEASGEHQSNAVSLSVVTGKLTYNAVHRSNMNKYVLQKKKQMLVRRINMDFFINFCKLAKPKILYKFISCLQYVSLYASQYNII